MKILAHNKKYGPTPHTLNCIRQWISKSQHSLLREILKILLQLIRLIMINGFCSEKLDILLWQILRIRMYFWFPVVEKSDF